MHIAFALKPTIFAIKFSYYAPFSLSCENNIAVALQVYVSCNFPSKIHPNTENPPLQNTFYDQRHFILSGRHEMAYNF